MQWMRAGFRSLICWGAVLALAGAAAAQTASPGAVPLQTTVSGALQSMASRAATIFSGQVVSIERHAGVVQITFRVEQPVAGSIGTTYVLREWAGLWPAGQFRYYVGERALLFVHATSAAGFASPVNGQEGVIPVLVQGADAPALLDVRRVAAGLQRALGTPLAPEGEGAVRLSDAVALITAVKKAGAASVARLPELPHLPMPAHVYRFPASNVMPGSDGRVLQQGRPVALGGSEVLHVAR